MASHPQRTPRMVYANESGEIIDLPDLDMAGKSGTAFVRPQLPELIPLPGGSDLFLLPDRHPVGMDPGGERHVTLTNDPHDPKAPAIAVGAFVAPAHTAIYSAAYRKAEEDILPLPLFAYTAVGWHEGSFWVAAFRSDPDPRQDADRFVTSTIKANTLRQLRKFPGNRLIRHLGKCCLAYGCPAARNYFMGRWEAPVPTSPSCNADCIGCISLQTSGCCRASQDRIDFVPSAAEITEMAVPHLLNAPRPIISFGQGCEGEPLLQAGVIEQAIGNIRRRTARGTINLNTNASFPDRVERLAHAGLDSIRVSLNSAREDKYALYYRPKGYAIDDVKESIRIMKRQEKFVSINYFILPGFTDDAEEMSTFFDLVDDLGPDMIQLRNLNMDPDWYLGTLRYTPSGEPAGILNWLAKLKRTFPFLRFGYFNPYLGRE
jgi:pyruvate-formate lyase-activating enzyme